ncbi:hypothetical protein [Aggregatibacter actinomycetemcomitans]|uniref:hypothetical protein n=1 Tax=Aggregatibacter actinomycetemcomitans TaxID=714 RepID=UPI00197C1900|nr:hypothetical protein [Aggregatibacter actinomycetemcomitans]MBN6064215.1 hypothetical protein [Aggregatibacter actinomycetemcomitans]MBN6081291.1 hypothetical protein [Aggregatibacter actinomycetemcomitans]MBN6084058.1 hypothetical protein [Aggregatibacter actinomycetemcomitans]
MAKKIDEQLWVRVLELERALKEQEEQTKQKIDELEEQHRSIYGYFQGLCFICAAVGTFCVYQLFN